MTDVTFVVPRYGAEVVGGAEGGARSLATRLAADGTVVRVLTSCARSHLTWADELPAGHTDEDGVAVHRFPVDRPRRADFDALSDRVLPAAASVDRPTALAWVDDQGPTSAALLDAVAAVDTGVLAFYPYLYHPTVRGLPLARVPTVLHAAAHREPPLDLVVYDDVFAAADGLAHHSRAEQELVLERFPATRTTAQVVLGLPVDEPPPIDGDGATVRRSLGIGDEPFALCVGRIDEGKGTLALVERFAHYRAHGGPGHLVLAGPVVDRPRPVAGVQCLGPVPEDQKWALMAAADVLVNPSPHESFSLVILEAWLSGTAVLVNGWCGPTREHCERSGGGLSYTGIADFDLALGRLFADPSLRQSLAAAGGRYVRENYAWPAVRARYDRLLARLG